VAGPQINDRALVDVDGNGGPHLGAGGNALGERLSHPLEWGRAKSVDRGTRVIPARHRKR
jgi:hypothetical protein